MSHKRDPGVAGARAAWRYRGNERPAFAIHPDPDAPIFEVADLCLEVDPQEVLPALLEALAG